MNLNIPNLNTKILIGLSAFLAILFLVSLLMTTANKNKKPGDNQQNFVTPTKVQVDISPKNISTPTPAPFTGVKEEPIPTEQINLVNQKKDLRNKLPLSFSTFKIDFDYTQDKFTVTLNTPKDISLKEFLNWRTTNYPALNLDQFIIN